MLVFAFHEHCAPSNYNWYLRPFSFHTQVQRTLSFPLLPFLQLKLISRLGHRALVHLVVLDTANPCVHMLPRTTLRNESECEDELDGKAHHDVGGAYGVVH